MVLNKTCREPCYVEQNHHHIIFNGVCSVCTMRLVIEFGVNEPVMDASSSVNPTPFVKSNQALIIQD